MASLVIHSEEPIQAASFTGRALIGRKPFNGVQLGQRIVSRIHAWIDRKGDAFFIRDARSRGGTFVNGARTDGPVQLHDGDEIKVGTSRITFHLEDVLPEGAILFKIAEDGTNPDFVNPGILITCDACGAPMWVPATMAGAFGRCAICTGPISVPGEPPSGIRRPLTPHDSIVDMPAINDTVDLGDLARPIDPLAAEFPQPQPNAAEARTCSVCQSPILPGEVTTQCPSCSQTYHAECWRENRGCAAYGCAEVGALDAVPAAAAIDIAPTAPEEHHDPDPEYAEPALAARNEMPVYSYEQTKAFPWDFALLGGSVFGTLIGAITFGFPALIVGIASAIYAVRSRDGKYRLAALSAAICLVGVACGIISSSFIWNVPLPWRLR
jgi:hypothetical protein